MASDLTKYGLEKPAFGSKMLKRGFEKASTRAAVKGPEGVTRGITHSGVYEDIAVKRGGRVSFDDIIDEAYNPITDELTGKYIEGFTEGQEGRFSERTKVGERRYGKGIEGRFASSEQIAIEEKELAQRDPGEARRRTRAGGSADPDVQARRRNRAKRTHGFLEKMNEEEKLLRNRTRPNPRKSPEGLRKLELDAKSAIPGASRGFRDAVRDRLRLIDRRKGVLKALGRKAGLLGLVASPYTTGEALVGLGSRDQNERLRAVEILQGLPDFSTGRSMTNKEKKETPVWHDPTTGEWKI